MPLILSRRPGQTVTMTHRTTGETIKICLSRVGVNVARIGFEANGDWHIVRDELPPLDLSRVPEMGIASNHVTKSSP